jgi:dihydroflavonol-4-reductase
METMARVRRRELFLTIGGLGMSKHRKFFSSAKAERGLGYKARPYPEARKVALALRGNGQPR